MKIDEILTESDNLFYRVEKPFKVFVNDKLEPTNHYYGSARYHKMKYKEFELEVDDEVHRLAGGIFFITVYDDGNQVHEGVFVKPDNFSPFEKNYGSSYTNPNDEAIKILVSQGKLVKIDASRAEKVKSYRS